MDVGSWLTQLTHELMRFDDTSTVLDRILREARSISQADAGTIYLTDENDLVFAYTHNDTLFPVETAYKYTYANVRLPISETSIAGYCAIRRLPLNLPDVRRLPDTVPFKFNDAFDHTTGYRTVSMLALPMLGRKDCLRGVIQLINSMGPEGPRPFTQDMVTLLELLTVQAVSALERSLLLRNMLGKMQELARLNDPLETGTHAQRVGILAAEIYQSWAERNNVPVDERRRFRSQLSLAATLHDLGKVAIPHAVLKKKGRLTDEEFRTMQTHCAAGARLFHGDAMDCAAMTRDIILHHHQKWNGTGYTGDPNIAPRSGEDIPLAARITAVADVFDALVSPRCYKPAWGWAEAFDILRRDAGSHFDPEVVAAFLDIADLVRDIFARYPEPEPQDI